MQKLTFKSLFLIISLLFYFVGGIHAQHKVKEKDLINLYNQMIGFYSSEEQSFADSSYFHIKLKMVPMWASRDGYWLYVEQAMNGKEDQPYRQRVYQLQIFDDTTIVSKIYTLKDEKKYVGEWKYEHPLESLTIDDLEERDGCAVYLHKASKNEYFGGTLINTCASSLKGAAYATSIVSIFPDMMISWDRGFNTQHEQVWGAEKGGYIFVKYEQF